MALLTGGRWQSLLLYTVKLRFPRCNLCTAASEAREWSGLQAWRMKPVDERRLWGSNNKSKEPVVIDNSSPLKDLQDKNPTSLAEWGALVLNTPDPALKASITHHAFRLWSNNQLPLGTASAPDQPARPEKPVLVPLRKVPTVRDSPLPRNAHAIHILAHIELNAVDLAWDTVVRFSGCTDVLDLQFFTDFLHVADDESRHFGWCSQRLSELGFSYGDMPAHNMLVNEGQKSSASVMARLAVVPMVQEARGLDSGPRIVERLIGWGDVRSASIVNQIAEEEVAHVAVGVSWFLSVCKMLNKVPETSFKELMQELNMELKGPFNHEARSKAGLPRDWYEGICEGSLMSKAQNEQEIKDTKGMAKQDKTASLSQVYNRLEYLVAMEKTNSG